MHSERRKKQLLRATHSMEYTSLMSASIADIIRREVSAGSQTSSTVTEFRRTLYMLHDYNTLVFKCTYHYPISTETKLLLRRYVELESYVLYKSKWTPEIEDQIQNRVFKAVMYFISGSYHATGQSIAEDRKLIFDEALKIFIHFADVSIDRFPSKILRNILNTLGIVNTSTNSDSALYVNNPSLKRLKEYLRDSDYGSDDDSVGSSEEAGIRPSSFKIHNEKKLLEKPPRVKFELNASNRVASSSSHGSPVSMPIINSSIIQDGTSVVNLLSKSGNELSSVNNLGVQSIPHNQLQVGSQISRFKSQERSSFPEICTMFQSSDFACSEKKCDFDSKPIMDKANDDFECIPTDFAYILDKRKRNTSIDELPYTPSKHQSNMIQLAQYRDDAITKVNELEPIVNLTTIPEFSIGIPEQKTTVTDESNIENRTSSSAMNMHSEFSSDSIFPSDLIVDESAIQIPLHLKTVSAENRDNGCVTEKFFNVNPNSLNQNNDSETIVTNVTVPSDDAHNRLLRSEMFSGCRVGPIQYTEILDESISTKINAPVHSSDNKSQVEELDYSNKHTDQSHSDRNNSYQNIINGAHQPVKGSRIQEILSLKEKSKQYKLKSSETFPLETHNSISLIVLSQNSISEKIFSDETQKLSNGDFNKLDTPLMNLIDNEGNCCTTSESSYENIAPTSKVKAGNTFNPICEDAIVDETTSTTITTQLYPESHQAPKNTANVNMSMIGDSSTITRLENAHDFTLEPQLASNKKEISIQESINKNKNFSAAIEHTSKTICETESQIFILEVGKSDENSSKYQNSLSENKGTTCDVHKIRINQKVQSVLEGTVILDKILDNESFTSKLTLAHGTCHIASDGKMAKIPKMKSQPDTENINSSPMVRKMNNFHPIKLINCTGDTELVSKEQEEYSNRNNTIINVHKQLKSNFEVEKELVDDNSLCGIIGENETNSIVDQPLVSNNTNDVSSTCELILEDKFGKLHKASIDDKRSTKIIHDLDTYKTQQYNRTLNLNWNGEPSSVVSLDNLQQNIVNDFVVDIEFVSTEEHRHSQESGSKHQLPLRNEELNFTFQRDVNGFTPKISKCITDDSGNTSRVNEEFPNVSQREIIEVINNSSASFESNDDLNMQNKSEERKTKSSCLAESNEYTSAENSSHSIPGLSGDILIIKEGEKINSISDQSLDSINTKDTRSLSSEEKSEDAFEDVNSLPISDNSCSPNILHDSESDQIASDLYVNTNTITTPFVTLEASNQRVNNDFDVETRLDFDKHKIDPTQGNNSENLLLVASKALPKSSIKNENTINFRSSGQKENDSSGSGFLEARNKIDDDLSVEIENHTAFTHETKVPLFDANKGDNISVQNANEYHQNIENHTSVCEKNQSSITENRRTFQSADEMLTTESGVNEIEEVISSSEEALKIDLDRTDSGIRVITECVDIDTNIIVNVDSTFESELPSLLIDHNLSSKKEEKILLDYVMQDPNAIETTFCENISDGVNELRSIGKLESISEFSTSQESETVITYVSCLNGKSDLITSGNEIEEVVDSSSKKVVKFGLDMPDLGIKEITECVDIDTNVVHSSFETKLPSKSIDHDLSTKKEDKTVVDCVMQDPNAIETTFCENISDGVNELRAIAKLKSISELPTPIQESKATITHVSALNEESVLTSDVNEIEEVIDSSSQKAVKFDLKKPDSRIITEVVEVDSNITINSDSLFETESMDNDLTSKKEDETVVDCVMQDLMDQESKATITHVTAPNEESVLTSDVNEIEEVVDSSSQKAVKFDLEKPDSRIITEVVEVDSNITINSDRLFETESMDNDLTSKKEDETVVDCVMQDLMDQESKATITHVTAPNEESVLTSDVNEIEEVVDSSSQKAVKFDLEKPDSSIITEVVEVDSNITINSDSSFETESMDNDLTSKKEDETVVDCVMQDLMNQESKATITHVTAPNEESVLTSDVNEIEEVVDSSSQKAVKFDLEKPDSRIITEVVEVDSNITINSDRLFETESMDNDLTSKKEDETVVDCVMQDLMDQESKATITHVTAPNEESVLTSDVNEIEEVVDSSSQKAVKFDSEKPDSRIITEVVEVDSNITINSDNLFETESMDNDSTSKKEDKIMVDYVIQDPRMMETTFCDNVSSRMNELRSLKELKPISEFPIPSEELETAKTSVSYLNQESDFITSIYEIEEVIDSSSQNDVNIDLDKPDSAGIKQITDCVDINTNTINVDTASETDLPSESVDHDAPSTLEKKTIVGYVIQDTNVIETTFSENVFDGLDELRSFAELKSMSELPTASQASETVETYVSCLNEKSNVFTSGNGIGKVTDSSSQKAVKFDSDMPDLGIIEITECVDIDANVDCSSLETNLPSESNDHGSLLKKECKTIVDYVTKDPHVTETTFYDDVSDGMNEVRSIAELKSKSEFQIPSQESETAKTSVSCLNKKTDVTTSMHEIEEVLDSSSQKEVNMDLDNPDLSENKITECVVIDTNVITNVNSAFDKTLPSELIDPNSSSKKEVEITVDYVMQDSIIIESTVCENISDEMNGLTSVAEMNSISKFPFPTQELETLITSVSCLNQESDVITSVNDIEEVVDLSPKKDLKINLDKLDSGMKEITVDYEGSNVIETSFCEKVSNRVNDLKLIAELKSVSEFPNPTHELETPITAVTCLNQESTLLTDNTFSGDISSYNTITIEKKHKNKQTSDVLPTLPNEVNIENSMLLTCETSEDSFEKINKDAIIELGPGIHESPPDLNLKVINHTDSNEITEFQPLQNTLCNNISFKVHTDSMKETEILIEGKVNQQISEIMPNEILGNSTGSEIYETVSTQKVKSRHGKKISSQSITDFTAYSIQKKTNVAENNSDNIITKPNTTEPNKTPELNRYVSTEKVTLPIYHEVVDFLPTDDKNKMITEYETSSHYTKVIAESSPVDVNGVTNVSTNQEPNAKTVDTYYAFQVNSLPDELKMLADVASNRKHMKVAKGKPKTKVIIRNRSQKNFKRKTESCNNKKTVSKPQKAKNSKINTTDIKTDRNKIINGKMSSHIRNKKEKYLSLVVGKTCIEKPQKSNNCTSQSGSVSIRRRIKTLGELKHFDFSSFEKSNLNKLTDQPGYSENELEKKLKIVETIDTMKDLSCETEFLLDKQKLLANSIGDSETTKYVPINVLDDTLEKKNVSSEVKVDKHSTVFSEEAEKNDHQTKCLKHNELLDDRKINKKIARSDNEKSLQNNLQESVKVIVEEVFPMEYSGNIAKAIRTKTNPFELSSFYTEFVPCRLGVYTSPTRTADVPSTTNNVNSTKEDNFQKKTDIFGEKNSEYKCEESPPGDINNQRFDSYDQTFSGNNSKVTDISNFEVDFTSTPIKDITESCKNKSGCSGKRKCTFDDISLSSENNEKKLLENTSRKNKRKHSPKKIQLDELNQKAKGINTFSTDGEKRDKPCSVEKPPYVVDDTISKPKEIRKSIEHIVTSLKSCNSRDISSSSSYVKLQDELVDYNSDVKLSHGNVGNEEISILSNGECNKIVSHLPFNQNNQKQSNMCEITNHMLEAETKETENYKISSDDTCSNLCESVEISSVEKKEISSDETCPNLRDGVEAENAPCKDVCFPNILLSNINTVTEKQISIQGQNMSCKIEIEKPINLGVYSHLSEEQNFVDKIACDMMETLCPQKTECTENTSNCMEILVETVASISGQNSDIQDEFEQKLPVDDLSFLIDEANNSFERTNFVFSSASEVSRFLADPNTSQISETFEQNSVMNPENFDIRLVNSSFLETFVNAFPFCNDYDCIGSEVTVSSNILTDPLVGGQEEPIPKKEELPMDDTDGSANNLLLEAPSFNDYMFMYGHDHAQAISQQSSLEYEKNYCKHSQINSQKLLTEFQSDNKLFQTNSQQSFFEDDKKDIKKIEINSQESLTADENNDKLFQTNSPNCSTDNKKLAETACLPVDEISKNKLSENENSKKLMTNVSQVKVTSINLRNDISLRSRKDSMLSKSSDSLMSNNDPNKYEPKRKNKRKWSDSSLLTKDSIINESSISNTNSSVPKRKPSSETNNIQSKQIQETADSKVNTRQVSKSQVDNIGSSSRLNRLRSTSHTAAKVKETQKTQYDSMYDKVKSNQNRRAASKNINYSESSNDDHSSNKARKCKRIKMSTTSHDYTLHENYSEESCSSQNLEFEPLKSHDSSESNKSKGGSETRHRELVFDSRDFSSSEYSTCQRTERATCQRSQRTSKSDNFQTASQLSSSNHQLSRSRSDIRTDQYKEKHKDSSMSQNEKKVRFNEERSHKWRQPSSVRMSLEENKKRELFPEMPFRVGKQGTSSELDYEKDHKWHKKFSKLYPYTTSANMFSKQTSYGK